MRSFQTVNLGSVGQTAAKLLAFKLGGLKKSLPLRHLLQAHVVRVRVVQGPNHSQSLTDILTYRPSITFMERSKPLLKVYQAGPYFHRAYLVTI